MRNYLSALLAVVLLSGAVVTYAPPSHAAAPFAPAVDKRFRALEKGLGIDNAPASDGVGAKAIARATYDVAVSGYGSSTSDHGLGVYLPAKAIITRSYLQVVTQLADSGAGTLAVFCEDANNIKTATDLTGSASGALIEGASTGAASAFVGSIAAQCEIKARPAGVDLSAGKLIVFVEYVIGGV